MTDSAGPTGRAAPKKYGRLRWDGGEVIEADGINLTMSPGLTVGPSSDQSISLFKNEKIAKFYCDRLAGFDARNIVEIGIKSGGSAIFFTHLLPMEKYVGIEISGEAPYFDKYVARMNLKDRMRAYYNTDQGNRARLTEILDTEFGNAPIDFATDDASHKYEPTLSAFEVIFPRIRPGGYFVLEDWSCHAMGAMGIWEPPPQPLYNLVLELVLLNALRLDVISDIEIYPNIAFIRRGSAQISGAFSVKDLLVTKFGPLPYGNKR
jgi:Methyltransferase domain